MELEASRPVGGLSKVIRVLDKVGVFSRWTNIIGLAIFVIIIGFTFTDVILRYLFNSPVPNGTLVVELMMIVAVFFALAHTQNEKAHVSIDVITSKLKPRARLTLESITHLFSLATFGLVIWQVLLEIPWVIENNIVHSQAWNINKGPFLVIIAIGCTCLDLLILRDFLVKIRELSRLGARR
ncbi:MAG: TRAP transporter small permease, partial [Dehalococcoidales bacterium]|nr:TRAP transporter small permease [Dehalococcoidales bacterium]